MVTQLPEKKRIVISYHNLSPELQDELKVRYPTGFSDHMIRIDRPDGAFFYAVVLDTDEIRYLVKVDVKIDDKPDEEEEKDYYADQEEDDDIKGAEELADSNSDDDE